MNVETHMHKLKAGETFFYSPFLKIKAVTRDYKNVIRKHCDCLGKKTFNSLKTG